MKKFLLVFLVLISGCTSPDNTATIIPNTDTILTIFVENDVVSLDKYRMFYSVKGINGEDLGFGELLNSDTIELKNLSYTGEKIAVTIFSVSENTINTIRVRSYLDVSLGKSITLYNNIPFQDSTTSLKINNFPTDFDEIIIARSGHFSPANFIFEEPISYQFLEVLPFTCITTNLSNDKPQYQTLNLESNSDQIIDLNNNIAMENEHTITSTIESIGNLEYAIRLHGLQDNNLTSFNDYVLYRDFDPKIVSNKMEVYTPSVFQDFKLILTAKSDNTSYIQRTVGEIPTTFDFINPQITVNNSTFENMSISSTGSNVSYINSLWKWNPIDSNGITWEVISPASINTDYRIYEIPDFILQEVDSLRDSEPLSLISVSSVYADDLEYSQVIDKLFITPFRYGTPQTTSLFPKTLVKKIDINQL
ncbi:hypothetical protein [Aquimarina sp. MMG016]|uniref:hypothetical protein n=1 Tax=Aquimarina sp. MMG016 TaxID=2822690 RepID=UPI001B3A645D|nr:hypothetical protein [Aquimarina sp. MMG016]MBQ4822325.1 hypothetical protein [Aquimarina sp. MMG016]